MRYGIISSMAATLASASLALAQAAPLPPPPGTPLLTSPGVAPRIEPTPVIAGPGLASPDVPVGAPLVGDPGNPQMFPTDPAEYAQAQAHSWHIWTSGEYLLWWTKKGTLDVPLVTTGPPATAGVLGFQGTQTLFGDQNMSYGMANGARMSIGVGSFSEKIGLELVGLLLAERTLDFNVAADAAGSRVLARPVVNIDTGEENVLQISTPNVLTGRISIQSSTELSGMEANFLANVVNGPNLGFDVIVGFRYLDLHEDLIIRQQSTVLGGSVGPNPLAIVPNQDVSILDEFKASNQFYGGQLGGQWEIRFAEKLYLHMLGKAALGTTSQTTEIRGASIVGGVPFAGSGLLAQPSNSARISDSEFVVIPEASATIGWQVNCYLRLYVGATFLYWGHVARPGDQVNRNVSPVHVPASPTFDPTAPPVTQPAATRNDSNFWATGFNFGFAFRY